MDHLKSQLFNNYLEQQIKETYDNKDERALTIMEMPDQESLEEFKSQVRLWVDIDNNIRKLKKTIQEENASKKNLNESILRFMVKYNIEDLNTKDGSKLRYKVNQVKCKPSVSDIKKRLVENYNVVKNIDELQEKLFVHTKETQKQTLRRINVKN